MPQKSGSKSKKGCAACAKGELNAVSPIHSCYKSESLYSQNIYAQLEAA